MILTGKLTENNPHVSCRRLLVERCLMNSSTQVKTNILPCMSSSIHGFEARLFGRVCFCQRDWHAGWRKDGHHASDDAASAILGRGAPAYPEKDHAFV